MKMGLNHTFLEKIEGYCRTNQKRKKYAVKQAVILAAGNGTRLNSILKGLPKCLLPFDKHYLIEYQIALLKGFGVEEICVVLGYQAEKVRQVLEPWDCDVVVNKDYSETNSLYSLWMTRHWVAESFILSNCDILAHPDIYRSLWNYPNSVVPYDSSSGTEAEHMKVSIQNNQLKNIGKALPQDQTSGESVGILKIEKSCVKPLFEQAEITLSEDGVKQWAPAALNRLAQTQSISTVDIANTPWAEMDFPEDVELARNRVWPQIEDVVLQGANACDELITIH